jgi:hypothetical protein
MTLVSSGELSIGGSTTNRSINLELGRSATASSNLNETALRTLAGVASGQISISNFYGKSSYAAVLNQYSPATYDIHLSRTASNFSPNYAEASVGITLYNDGTAIYWYATHTIATTNFTSFTWKTGGGGVGDYYAYMYSPSGDAFSTSSGLDTALVLSTSRGWSSISGTYAGTVTKETISTLQIRDGSGNVLASRSLRFYTEADSS